MEKDELIKKYKHKLVRAELKETEYEQKKDRLSVHGYWSLGFYAGRVMAFDEILYDLEN